MLKSLCSEMCSNGINNVVHIDYRYVSVKNLFNDTNIARFYLKLFLDLLLKTLFIGIAVSYTFNIDQLMSQTFWSKWLMIKVFKNTFYKYY